jgi:hypothetical protein
MAEHGPNPRVETGIFRSFLSFGATVAAAVHFGWTARDLLWALWISSLTVGYLTILFVIVGGLVSGRVFWMKAGRPGPTERFAPVVMALFFLIPILAFFGLSPITLVYVLVTAIAAAVALLPPGDAKDGAGPVRILRNVLVNLPSGFFMLAFFTVHFGGFHFVHSLFLNGFFPLVGDAGFGRDFDEIFVNFGRFVRISAAAYWPVILSTALSQAGNIPAAAKRAGDNVMFIPYKNVIRMHLMIFIIAFMSIGGLHAYVLYAALFVYFFPLENIFRKKECRFAT